MTDQYENMLIEVAQKHGVALDKKDPILIVYTLNQRMISEQTLAHQQVFEEFKSQMEEVMNSYQFENKTQAEKILTASLESSKKVMLDVMNENADKAATAVREEVDNIVLSIKNQQKEVKQTSYINLFSSILTLVSACIVIYGITTG